MPRRGKTDEGETFPVLPFFLSRLKKFSAPLKSRVVVTFCPQKVTKKGR